LIVLAVDPGIDTSGYSMHRDGRFVASGTIRNTSGWNAERKKRAILAFLKGVEFLVKGRTKVVVVVEDQFFRRNLKALKTMVEVKELFTTWARYHDFDVATPLPGEWQQGERGLLDPTSRKKRPELKELSVEKASGILGVSREEIGSDESDAVCIGHWYLATMEYER